MDSAAGVIYIAPNADPIERMLKYLTDRGVFYYDTSEGRQISHDAEELLKSSLNQLIINYVEPR